MRWIVLAGLALSMTACGSWNGDGNAEVLPDVLGMTTGAKKWLGVPQQLTPGEQADRDITYKGILTVESEPATGVAEPGAAEHGTAAPAHKAGEKGE